MLEVHLLSTAADVLVLTAVTGTLLLHVPSEQAKARIGIALALLFLPTLLIGRFWGHRIDRVKAGRRATQAGSTAVRAGLALALALGITLSTGNPPTALYVVALGVLVCQKAFLVSRAAPLARILPSRTGLTSAATETHRAGAVATTIAAPIGLFLVLSLGPVPGLCLAAFVYASATTLALTQWVKGDRNQGEVDAWVSTAATLPDQSPKGMVPQTVTIAVAAGASLRMFGAFFAVLVAFLFRADHPSGLPVTTALVAVAFTAVCGVWTGTVLTVRLAKVRSAAPAAVVLTLAAVSCTAAALSYSIWPLLLCGLLAGIGHVLSATGTAATVQRVLPKDVRVSAMSRAGLMLNASSLLGALIAVAMPVSGSWILGVGALGAIAGAALIFGTMANQAWESRVIREPVFDD